MSSREIAELVDSRHDKVKQSIERLSARGVIGIPPVGEYLDSLGRPALQYLIGKRDSYVIVEHLVKRKGGNAWIVTAFDVGLAAMRERPVLLPTLLLLTRLQPPDRSRVCPPRPALCAKTSQWMAAWR